VAYAIFASLTLAGLSTAVLSSFNGTTSVFAQEQKFNSKLTGQSEVPPKTTEATGTAFFSITERASTMKLMLQTLTTLSLLIFIKEKQG
jgi:hypothetical protein